MTKPGGFTLDPSLTKTTPLNVTKDREEGGTGSSTTTSHADEVAKQGVNKKDLKAGEKLGNEPMTQPPTPVATDVAAVVKPETDEITALPKEYADAIAKLNNLSTSATSTPVNPAVAGAPGEAANLANQTALEDATNNVTSDLEGGEKAIGAALSKMGGAEKTLVNDLPYADILATSLMQKKNQLLYGTTPASTFAPVNETSWDQHAKDIYAYIQGSSGGNTTVANAPTKGGIQDFEKAAQAATSGGGSGQSFQTSGQLGT